MFFAPTAESETRMTGQSDDGERNDVSERRLTAWSEFSTTRFGEEDRWQWLVEPETDAGQNGDEEQSDPVLEQRWYWDYEQRKAYYPCYIGDETVRFVTVWHRDEVAGALEDAGLVPVEYLGPPRTENQFVSGPFDSFRILPEEEVAAYESVYDGDVDPKDDVNGDSGADTE
jgi:hypothetical protein